MAGWRPVAAAWLLAALLAAAALASTAVAQAVKPAEAYEEAVRTLPSCATASDSDVRRLKLRRIGCTGLDLQLVVTALDRQHAYVHAQFETRTDVALGRGGEMRHYRLLPRALGDLLQRLRVVELHVALAHGRWRADRWGYPLDTAPTGAEVRAWLAPGDEYVGGKEAR